MEERESLGEEGGSRKEVPEEAEEEEEEVPSQEGEEGVERTTS